MTIFKPEDLTHYAAGLVTKKKAKRHFADTTIVPHSENIQKGIKRIVYTSIKPSGSAAMTAWGAPFSGLATNRVATDERFVPIQPVHGVYEVSEDEVLQGAIVDVNSVQVRVAAAVQQVLEKIDEVGYVGEPDFGIYGITNTPNVNILVLPADGTGPIPTSLASKNTSQIVETLNLMINNTSKLTSGVYRSPHILMPTSAFIVACETLDSQADNESAMTIFLKNARQIHPDIKVTPMPFLDTASPTGGSVAVIYDNDPDMLEYVRVKGVTIGKLHEGVGGFTGKVSAYLGGIAIKDATPFSLAFGI